LQSYHIKRAKTDAAMQNNCLVCCSLSWNQKLFNTKVRRGEIFTSKWQMHQKLFGDRALPGPAGRAYNSPSILSNWI